MARRGVRRRRPAHGLRGPDWLGVYLELVRKLCTQPELREQWTQRNPELNEELRRRVAKLQERGELRNDLDADQIGRFLGLLTDGIAVQISSGFPIEIDPLLTLVGSAIGPQ